MLLVPNSADTSLLSLSLSLYGTRQRSIPRLQASFSFLRRSSLLDQTLFSPAIRRPGAAGARLRFPRRLCFARADAKLPGSIAFSINAAASFRERHAQLRIALCG